MKDWSALPLGPGVEVLVRDANGVGALAKPAGVLSLPNRPGDEPRSLLKAGYQFEGECYQWPGGRLWLLNRLDSATSGVILVADTAEVAQVVREHFKRRDVRKTYQALVFGKPIHAAEDWKDKLAVDKRGGVIRTGAGHIPAEARMATTGVLPAGGGLPPLALIKLEPKTGRSHQLRVQCSRRRLPIVGDLTYGDFKLNRAFVKAGGSKRLFLHSLATRFQYTRGGKTFDFAAEAPLPAEFREPFAGA